jgi:hypothetical protein
MPVVENCDEQRPDDVTDHCAKEYIDRSALPGSPAAENECRTNENQQDDVTQSHQHLRS